MARQRLIHPGFWSSKKILKLYKIHGPEAALFYLMLMNNADDEGRGYTDIDWLTLKAPILTISKEPVKNWLETSNNLELICLYSEKNFYFLPDWFEKQTIPKPYPSEIILPDKKYFAKYPNYFLSLLKQKEKIYQRFNNEGKITNQLETSIELVKNQLETSLAMKLKEVKGKEVKGKEKKNNNVDDVNGFSPSNFINLWNLITKSNCETTNGRLAKIKIRLKEKPEEIYWQKVFNKTKESSFLNGDNDRGWKADLSWIIKNDTNHVNVIEGKYDNKLKTNPASDYEARIAEYDRKIEESKKEERERLKNENRSSH